LGKEKAHREELEQILRVVGRSLEALPDLPERVLQLLELLVVVGSAVGSHFPAEIRRLHARIEILPGEIYGR
jgi:hypothetical protein